ncbi:MAG: dienelactone hydrolase family protein [Marivibrio sp.]|uniref:alpha/beta family hydrolase n=1 Tax=Marivibrio sp. TaxID=2039719 RepID=UPI0032EAD912
MQFLAQGPSNAPRTLILAHGAGAPMDSDVMNDLAGRLATAGLRVLRFEFPYMAERRASGKKKPPDREPKLLDAWRTAVAAARVDLPVGGRLALGGKSMGGRMASLIADEAGADALVCFGYPFHPPGKPDRLRTAHLETIRTPTLICQGERDPFGRRAEVEAYALSGAVELFWAPDGDHDLKPRKASGLTHADALDRVSAAAARWLENRLG